MQGDGIMQRTALVDVPDARVFIFYSVKQIKRML